VGGGLSKLAGSSGIMWVFKRSWRNDDSRARVTGEMGEHGNARRRVRKEKVGVTEKRSHRRETTSQGNGTYTRSGENCDQAQKVKRPRVR